MTHRDKYGGWPDHWPVLTMYGGSYSESVLLLNRIMAECENHSLQMVALFAAEFAEEVTTTANNRHVMGDSTWRIVCNGENEISFRQQVESCVVNYDLIILVSAGAEKEGRISLEDSKALSPVATYDDVTTDVEQFVGDIILWLTKKNLLCPVWACVLIGGESRRMGQPKHLIELQDGLTWLEKTVSQIEKVTDGIVLSGKGDIPASLSSLTRLVDVSESCGPIAGVLSAMRWKPHVGWLVVACDMPEIEQNGLTWLLNTRSPGVWGCIPRNPQTGQREPLLAYYDFRSRRYFEDLVRAGTRRIGQVGKKEKIAIVDIPENLVSSWLNCNTLSDVKLIRRSSK